MNKSKFVYVTYIRAAPEKICTFVRCTSEAALTPRADSKIVIAGAVGIAHSAACKSEHVPGRPHEDHAPFVSRLAPRDWGNRPGSSRFLGAAVGLPAS